MAPKAPAKLKPEDLTFAKGFLPTNLTILADKGRTIIAAFDGEYNGRKIFNIRELFEQYGDWTPGKGVSVPMERKEEFIKALSEFCNAELAPKSAAAA